MLQAFFHKNKNREILQICFWVVLNKCMADIPWVKDFSFAKIMNCFERKKNYYDAILFYENCKMKLFDIQNSKYEKKI